MTSAKTSSHSPCVQVVSVCALVVVLLAAPSVVRAASYTGYSDTGFRYANKGACCEEAVYMAQENSARDCERAGGYADFRRTSARGRCDWSTKRAGDGRSVYRCTANASIPCR